MRIPDCGFENANNMMNHLSGEKSAYLQHAALQPIDWHPWSDEAFDRARREDKPVFLSIGAVWCHWCHVMAKESFEDEETARVLNEHFISIKLDRDEHPDIDRRYQQAVAAMGAGGGWPLSVFLTPDRESFFGGTYFPPRDLQGRPGFKNVLRSVNDFYKTKRGDVADYAQRVGEALRPEALAADDLSETSAAEAETTMLSLVDQEHGGFGVAPKFPMPGALEFLLRRSGANADSPAGGASRRMLEAMAAGGFHDHLAGGFHRYSVDAAWTIPHFEKMADDNAGLLKNYVDGYAVFGDERFREVALDIIAFTRDVLSDPEGGFFASQDADVTPDDEGGYFLWTEEEFRKVLDHDEDVVLSAHLFHEQGRMRHDSAKKVLFEIRSPRETAEFLGRDEVKMREILLRGKRKLLAVRATREMPFLDKTLYASLNGMLISAWFHAAAVLRDEHIRDFAIKSLERVLRERLVDGRLSHVHDVPAVLDDYVHLIDALIAAYEGTAERRYLALADDLMADCLRKFNDTDEGGLFDTDGEVLGTRLKRVDDVPHASANAVAIMVLLKLSLITGKDEYRGTAERTLRIFSRSARDLGVHAGAYFCALDAWFRMIKLMVEAPPAGELAREARALAGRVYTAVVYGEDRGRVVPCRGSTCHEPISEPSLLLTVCTKL